MKQKDLFGNEIQEKPKSVETFVHPILGKKPIAELVTKIGIKKRVEYFETVSDGFADCYREKFKDKVIHSMVLNDGIEIFKVNKRVFNSCDAPMERIKRKIW
jgi:hypothetical protein